MSELSFIDFPFTEEVIVDLFSLFGLELSFCVEGLLIESIFLSEFFLFIRLFIFLLPYRCFSLLRRIQGAEIGFVVRLKPALGNAPSGSLALIHW